MVSMSSPRERLQMNGMVGIRSMLRRGHGGTHQKMSPRHFRRDVGGLPTQFDIGDAAAVIQVQVRAARVGAAQLPHRHLETHSGPDIRAWA